MVWVCLWMEKIVCPSVCKELCVYLDCLQGESRNRGNDEIVVRVFNKYKASNIGEPVEWCV